MLARSSSSGDARPPPPRSLNLTQDEPERYTPFASRSSTSQSRAALRRLPDTDDDDNEDEDEDADATLMRSPPKKRTKVHKSSAQSSKQASSGKENVPLGQRQTQLNWSGGPSQQARQPSSQAPKKGKGAKGKAKPSNSGQVKITSFMPVRQTASSSASQAAPASQSAVKKARPVPGPSWNAPQMSSPLKPSKAKPHSTSGAAVSHSKVQPRAEAPGLSSAKGKEKAVEPRAREQSPPPHQRSLSRSVSPPPSSKAITESEPPETEWETPPPATWQRNAQSRQHLYRLANGVSPREDDDVYTPVPGRPGEKKVRTMDGQLHYEAVNKSMAQAKVDAVRIKADAQRRMNGNEVRPFEMSRGKYFQPREGSSRDAQPKSNKEKGIATDAPRPSSPVKRHDTPGPAETLSQTQDSEFDAIPERFRAMAERSNDDDVASRLASLFGSKAKAPPAPAKGHPETLSQTLDGGTLSQTLDGSYEAPPVPRLRKESPKLIAKDESMTMSETASSLNEDLKIMGPPAPKVFTAAEVEPPDPSSSQTRSETADSEMDQADLPAKGPARETMPDGLKTQIPDFSLFSSGDAEGDDGLERTGEKSHDLRPSQRIGYIKDADLGDGLSALSQSTRERVLALDTYCDPEMAERRVAAGARRSVRHRYSAASAAAPAEQDARGHADDPDRTLVGEGTSNSGGSAKRGSPQKLAEKRPESKQTDLSRFAAFSDMVQQKKDRDEARAEEERRREVIKAEEERRMLKEKYRENEVTRQIMDRAEGKTDDWSENSDDEADDGDDGDVTKVNPEPLSSPPKATSSTVRTRYKPRRTFQWHGRVQRNEEEESQAVVYLDATETQDLAAEEAALQLADDEGAEETQPLFESQLSSIGGGGEEMDGSSASGSVLMPRRMLSVRSAPGGVIIVADSQKEETLALPFLSSCSSSQSH